MATETPVPRSTLKKKYVFLPIQTDFFGFVLWRIKEDSNGIYVRRIRR